MPLTFYVLGRDRNEVGDNLESLAKELYANLGFGSFIRNAYTTGAEIDLQARHRVTDTPLICECKAHKAPLNTHAIKLFHSQWEKKRKTDKRLFGVFISTSGFVGTAKQWYEELDAKTRKNFVLVDADDLLNQLIDTKLTLSPEAISTIIKQRNSIDQPDTYWLSYSKYGLAWFFVYTIAQKHLVTIVDGFGESMPAWKAKELFNLLPKDMSDIQLFGLDLRQRVQIELFAQEGVTAQYLSQTTQETVIDVQLALDTLEVQGIIQKKEDETFLFVRDIVPFIITAKGFLPTKEAISFLSSTYAQNVVRSNAFISYIDNRYKLEMNNQWREITAQLLSLSPSALLDAITLDPAPFIQTRQDIEQIQEPSKKAELLELHRTSLLQKLIVDVAHNLTDQEHKLTGHISRLGIQRYRLIMRLDAVGNNWKTLSVFGEMMVAIEAAGENLAAGNLVCSSNPINAAMLNAMLFLEVKEFDQAKEEYEKALSLCESTNAPSGDRQAVLNNLALVYMRQEKWNEAVHHLTSAIGEGKPEYPELFANITYCYVKMNDFAKAQSFALTGIETFPCLADESSITAVLSKKALEQNLNVNVAKHT